MKPKSKGDPQLFAAKFGIEHPIIQAPMAGAQDAALAIAVCKAGGLGSLPCALLSYEQTRSEVQRIRAEVSTPFNLNFFCHQVPEPDPLREAAWQQLLEPYYRSFGIDPQDPYPSSQRQPFDQSACQIVEEFKPAVVSFHFGLPEPALLARVRASGAKIISSATTVEEALWLEAAGCDAVIAQGLEAGGHRGMFLARELASQMGTMALVPQIVDAIGLPVIASGGIGDRRGIEAAFHLGASAVQLGTSFLLSNESKVSIVHRRALESSQSSQTVLTNLFTGRAARSIVNRLIRDLGPIEPRAPAFPLAGGALGPLRSRAESIDSGDFSPLWSGQAARLARALPASEIMKQLSE